MKKIITLLNCLSLLFISCTNNDEVEPINTPSQNVNCKPNKIKWTDPADPSYLDIDVYTYQGNKIVKYVTNNGEFETRYTYTNDLITRIDYYESNVQYIYEEFTYNSDNKLIMVNEFHSDFMGGYTNRTHQFIYNIDGTVNEIHNNPSSWTIYKKYYLDSSGEIIKEERYNDQTYTNLVSTYLFTYDSNKNNPFKNITGFQNLGIYWSRFETNGLNLNLLTNNSPTDDDKFEINYDTYNYPVKIVNKRLTTNEIELVQDIEYIY